MAKSMLQPSREARKIEVLNRFPRVCAVTILWLLPRFHFSLYFWHQAAVAAFWDSLRYNASQMRLLHRPLSVVCVCVSGVCMCPDTCSARVGLACAAARATWPKYFNLKFVKIAHQEAFSGRLLLLLPVPLLLLQASSGCSREIYTYTGKNQQ